MDKKLYFLLICISLILGVLACNLPEIIGTSSSDPSEESDEIISSQEDVDILSTESDDDSESEDTSQTNVGPESAGNIVIADPQTIDIDPVQRIQPGDLHYLGAFRLPGESGGSNWEYSGHGLTYFPDGDKDGSDDGFPGSLFGAGHDHQLFISEISIPSPVKSSNLDVLNTAVTLQEFSDISDGMFIPEEMAIPRIGIEFLPQQGQQTTPKIHFVWGQHIQDFELTHGWAEITLSNPAPAGPWAFDGYTNYVTADYIFEIPKEWADTYAQGMRLATGRAREGLWSGRGPGLFAYAPWESGNPPPAGETLTSINLFLLLLIQESGIPDIVSDESMAVNDYLDSDHWLGGAWLTAGDSSAVIFVGTKAVGNAWYGFANGVVWPMDCSESNSCPDVPEWPYEDRGFWAEDYEAQIIFYDTSDLAAVAIGQMETWEPQPYAVLSIQGILFDPELNPGDYKRDFISSAAFDRENGYLYIIERLGDEYKSVVHVWQVTGK